MILEPTHNRQFYMLEIPFETKTSFQACQLPTTCWQSGNTRMLSPN